LQQGGLQQGLNTQTFQPGTFIGNSAETMQNSFQNQTGQRRAVGLDFSIQNLNELNNSRQQNQQQQQSPVRVQLRPTYLLPASARALSTAQLQSQVAENLGERLQNGVELSFSGNLVTLAGTVSSDFERDVAAKMLSLQPGIEEVENRLATTEEEEVAE
jgi:osmotically-inducible protein OsmY